MGIRSLVSVSLLIVLACSRGASAIQLDDHAGPITPISPMMSYSATLPNCGTSSGVTYSGIQTFEANSGLDIMINAGPELQANPAALAAFNRAAAQWESRIHNSMTVTIDANLANLGSTTIIGSTSVVMLQTGYTAIRNAMVASAALEPDDGIVAALPDLTDEQQSYNYIVPDGIDLNGYVGGAKANFKALNFTGIDEQHGVTDATIQFNTLFGFDYDNRDGVAPDMMDFETVAAHEIGHALGFSSQVDSVDYCVYNGISTTLPMTTLDMFRFAVYNIPSTAEEFNSFPRSFVPGMQVVTKLGLEPWGLLSATQPLMATGRFTGDGRQASHWKDNLGIGIMDPTLDGQEVVPISEADFRALDLIGYDISPIPEPGTLLLLLTGLLGLLTRFRRAAV